MWGSLCATRTVPSTNSISLISCLRVFVLALSLAKLKSLLSDPVLRWTPSWISWCRIVNTAVRNSVKSVGANTHHCFVPWLILMSSLSCDPTITFPPVPSWSCCVISIRVCWQPKIFSTFHNIFLSTVSKALVPTYLLSLGFVWGWRSYRSWILPS